MAEKKPDEKAPWWRRRINQVVAFSGVIVVAAGTAVGTGLGQSLFSAASSHDGLLFNMKDSSWDYGMSDESAVSPGLLTAKNSSASVSIPPGTTKAGAKDVTLTITNDYDHPVTVTDIRLADIQARPPVAGTLFRLTAEGTGSNDLLGADLSQRPAVLRHVGADYGALGDPYFAGSHISIAPHDAEVLVITVYAGGPHAYTWDFKVDYDAGDGERTATPPAPPGVLSVTGYAHSYRRVYQPGRDGWQQARSAAGFCPATGISCYSGPP